MATAREFPYIWATWLPRLLTRERDQLEAEIDEEDEDIDE